MCTVSWYVDEHGYDVFFNRDEQKTRVEAIPPQASTLQGVRCIMPIDQESGGTWLSANEHGVSFALLNYYQGDDSNLDQEHRKSRGGIVRGLAPLASLSKVSAFIVGQDLNHYLPFTLLCFFPANANSSAPSDIGNINVQMIRWTGRQLESARPLSPIISSSVALNEVVDARKLTYQRHVEKVLPRENFRLNQAVSLQGASNDVKKGNHHKTVSDYHKFHASHIPEPSALSVCMHREDARTVSFSHLSIRHSQVNFHYSDGPPCETPIFLRASLFITS